MRSTKAAITITKLPSNTCFWGNFITTKLGEFLLLIVVLEREREGLCLVTIFVFYFQNFVFGDMKKKQFSCIFEIKSMFG